MSYYEPQNLTLKYDAIFLKVYTGVYNIQQIETHYRLK